MPPICLDCGAPTKSAAFVFCDKACRARWQNRRLCRGAQLYDFFCEFRVLRIGSHFKMICRLIAEWRREDQVERDGRRSWRNTRDWIERNPWIKGEMGVMKIGVGCKR